MGSNLDTDLARAATPEQLFPDRGNDIGRLRAHDPLFDEICTDFETVAGIARNEGLADLAIRECLAGLREEIDRALTRYARGSET